MFLGLAYGQDYFPLQTGNQWIYQSGGAFRSDPWVVEITGAETINGQEYFKVTGFPGIEFLRKNEAGTLIIYDREARAEKTWAAFGAATGEAWRTEASDCNSTAVITSRNAEVKLPVGDFNNALRIAYSFTRCADAGLTTETFLPSIGLAERRELSIAGERVYSLIYARVGDTVQVAGREWGFGVALNEATFRPGESIQVRMTLRNTKARPVKLVFPSGQDYDIVIRDSRNQVVYTWSASRSFITVIREVEIRGEKSWLARVNIGPSEANLQPGEYTLTASLAVTGNRFQTTVPLTIERPSQPGSTNAQ